MNPDPCVISISYATRASLEEVRALDFSFTVMAEIDPVFDQPVARRIRPVASWEKKYFNQPTNFSGYIDNSDTQLFVVRIAKRAVGYLAVSCHWNGLALIEDIAIDRACRRRGGGRKLLDAAQQWAKEKSLSGLMLETQNNNVAACLLYERYGFTLGGIDRDLYRALNAQAREIALFWYLWFT